MSGDEPERPPQRRGLGSCWVCGYQLHGGHGVTVKVYGSEVTVHKACVKDIPEDAREQIDED